MNTATSLETPFHKTDSGPDGWLLAFNDQVLAQGEALARQYASPPALDFAALVGPHLRHVVEHYEALLLRSQPHEADYDARPRDRVLEQSASRACERIAQLRHALAQMRPSELLDPLTVFTLGGVDGQWALASASTLGRELVFLASHAVHHFALLREHCLRRGVDIPPQFGIAPATVAYARRTH